MCSASAFLLGVILIAAKVDDAYNLDIAPYGMILGGICVLVVLALKEKLQQSLLCRIGLHKFVQMGQESDSPLLFLYKCERCGLEKKVMKAFKGENYMSSGLRDFFAALFVAHLLSSK